jgi:hypothetical protein
MLRSVLGGGRANDSQYFEGSIGKVKAVLVLRRPEEEGGNFLRNVGKFSSHKNSVASQDSGIVNCRISGCWFLRKGVILNTMCKFLVIIK